MISTPSYRYPGVKPFTQRDQNIFFGRKQEIFELSRYILQNRLVVLYARSGIGKSSLLNAGIIPLLQKSNEYLPLCIRLGAFQIGRETNVLALVKSYLPLPNGNCYLDKLYPRDESLWGHFKRYQALLPVQSDFVLLFDQFEELFTYPSNRIELFHHAMGELLNSDIPQSYRDRIENQPNLLTPTETKLLYQPLRVKVVFSIRSNRLSELDRLSPKLPDILDKRYHLKALNYEQAQDAILDPAFLSREDYGFQSSRFNYTDRAVDRLLEYLSKDGEGRIESFQLQVICQYAENKIVNEGLDLIDLPDLGKLAEIFGKYYDRQIAQLSNKDDQILARRMIEEGLIFEDAERRLSLYEGIIFHDYGLSPSLLQKLVDTHLLRPEADPKGGFVYELSHDTLVTPVLLAKRERKALEEKKSQQAILKKQATELTLERKKRHEARLVAVMGIGLALFSIVAMIFAIRSYQNAKEAEVFAQHQLANLYVRKANQIFLENKNTDIALLQLDSAAFLFPDKLEGVNIYLSTIENGQVPPHKYLSYLKHAFKLGVRQDSILKISNQYFYEFWQKKKYGLAAELVEWVYGINGIGKNWMTYYDTAKQFGAYEAAYRLLKLESQQTGDSSKIEKLGISLIKEIGGRPWPYTINKIKKLIDASNENTHLSSFPSMKFINGGSFQMGSNHRRKDSYPAHSVTISDFEISEFETTVGQYIFYLNSRKIPPSSLDFLLKSSTQILFDGVQYQYVNGEEGYPVTNVNWKQANEYIDWLSDTLNQIFALPTEAEWEFAASGNNTLKTFKYAGSDSWTMVGWSGFNSSNTLHPVGMLQANSFGIYDMSGNVWEWCFDRYDGNYYQKLVNTNTRIIDPMGPLDGEFVTRRGGTYTNNDDIQITNREKYYEINSNRNIGFRVVRLNQSHRRIPRKNSQQ